MRTLTLFLFLAALMLPQAEASAGQTYCWICTTDPDNHPEYGNIHWDNQGQNPWVSAPDGKHETWGLDFCSRSHQYEDCGGGGGGSDEDNDSDLLVLLEANTVDDTKLTRSFARTVLAGRAIFNRRRAALQILACDDPDLVVAHIPLDSRRTTLLIDMTRRWANLDR